MIKKLVREKVEKRLDNLGEDIPFGVPKDGKAHKELTEEERQDIDRLRKYALEVLEASKGKNNADKK